MIAHRPCRRVISSTLASISVRPFGIRLSPWCRRAILVPRTEVGRAREGLGRSGASGRRWRSGAGTVLVADTGGVTASAALGAVWATDGLQVLGGVEHGRGRRLAGRPTRTDVVNSEMRVIVLSLKSASQESSPTMKAKDICDTSPRPTARARSAATVWRGSSVATQFSDLGVSVQGQRSRCRPSQNESGMVIKKSAIRSGEDTVERPRLDPFGEATELVMANVADRRVHHG